MAARLLVLNGLSILAVIVFHAAGWGLVALYAWAGRYAEATGLAPAPLDSVALQALRVIEQAVSFAIPAFLFVSGYFMAFATPRAKRTVGWDVIWVRIRALLIPYLIWSVLVLLLAALEGRIDTPRGYLVRLLTGGANPAFYYVPLLIQFYLLAPLLIVWAKAHPWLLLAGSLLLQSLIVLSYTPSLWRWEIGTAGDYADFVPKWFFAVRIFWFSLGIVTGFHLAKVKGFAVRYRHALLALLAALFVVGVVEWQGIQRATGDPLLGHRETFVDMFYALALLLCFIGFEKAAIPWSRTLRRLGERSFGIYIVHSPVMEYTARLTYRFAPALLQQPLVFVPLIIAAGLAVPLVMMETVNRSPARPYYKWLFG